MLNSKRAAPASTRPLAAHMDVHAETGMVARVARTVGSQQSTVGSQFNSKFRISGFCVVRIAIFDPQPIPIQ